LPHSVGTSKKPTKVNNTNKTKTTAPRDSKQSKSTPSLTSQDKDAGISKTRMRKAIMAYWQEKFKMMYHRNQIKEFLSEEGFVTTPVEQQTLYVSQKDNESFIKFCQFIHAFEFGEMGEAYKEKLYAILTQ